MEISVMLTSHWVIIKKPLSIIIKYLILQQKSVIGHEKKLLIATLELTFLFVVKHVMEVFNAVRSCFKSRDEWKISFRDLHDEICTGLWKSLLGIKVAEHSF